jgi:GrpB-like predicted nucleotidyltransferase (UPF0157 family)
MALGLGPIARLVEYNPEWPRLYLDEKARILAAIGPWVSRIEHVGSTAVQGLAAKPILDILVGLRDLADAGLCIPRMEGLGYEYVPEYEKELPMRRYFRKGPRENRTHHVHMVEEGSDFWLEHLRFRDYLRDHPKEARRYERLKRDLAARFANDRDAYTASKAEFIRSILSQAAEAGY